MRGYTKVGGKKCFPHMDEVFEKINEKTPLETFIYMTLGSLFCIFTHASFYLSSYPWQRFQFCRCKALLPGIFFFFFGGKSELSSV